MRYFCLYLVNAVARIRADVSPALGAPSRNATEVTRAEKPNVENNTTFQRHFNVAAGGAVEVVEPLPVARRTALVEANSTAAKEEPKTEAPVGKKASGVWDSHGTPVLIVTVVVIMIVVVGYFLSQKSKTDNLTKEFPGYQGAPSTPQFDAYGNPQPAYMGEEQQWYSQQRQQRQPRGQPGMQVDEDDQGRTWRYGGLFGKRENPYKREKEEQRRAAEHAAMYGEYASCQEYGDGSAPGTYYSAQGDPYAQQDPYAQDPYAQQSQAQYGSPPAQMAPSPQMYGPQY